MDILMNTKTYKALQYSVALAVKLVICLVKINGCNYKTMKTFDKSSIDQNGQLNIPDYPIIPFIMGDGIGPDIWKASGRVFDHAVEKVYAGKREIQWKEVLAGEKAFNQTGSWLPEETLRIFKEYLIGIK